MQTLGTSCEPKAQNVKLKFSKLETKYVDPNTCCLLSRMFLWWWACSSSFITRTLGCCMGPKWIVAPNHVPAIKGIISFHFHCHSILKRIFRLDSRHRWKRKTIANKVIKANECFHCLVTVVSLASLPFLAAIEVLLWVVFEFSYPQKQTLLE